MRKKTGVLTAIILAVALAAGGCGKEATPENLFTDMAKSSKEVKSVSASMKLSADMNYEGASVGVSVDADVKAMKKPEMTHINGNMKMNYGGFDLNTDMEMYQTKENDAITVYTKIQDQWLKDSKDTEESTFDVNMFKQFKKLSSSFKRKDKLKKINGKNCFELTGKIKGQMLTDIMGADMLNSIGSQYGVSLEDLKEAELPCVIDIYKDSILPARMKMDGADLLKKMFEENGYEGMDIEEYYVEINYKEYNKVKEIKIPQEAIDSAVSTKDLQGGGTQPGL